MRPPAQCGTRSAYNRHLRLGERPCDACATAAAEYIKTYLSAPDKARNQRLRRLAHQAAGTRLRAMYPTLWEALHAEELDRLTAEERAS